MLSVQLPSFYREALCHLDFTFSVCAEYSLAVILFSRMHPPATTWLLLFLVIAMIHVGRRLPKACSALGWLRQIARPRGCGASGRRRRRYGIRGVANEEVAEVEALLVVVAVEEEAAKEGNSAADLLPRRSL